ncbi:M13 family metallopeptidase [Spiroplasma sp. BIUS-1]|uniref:M13 family metallopeptidase n=1 Tax=Spiroplasma sp. BIUS-1 TaxID=216964 RepID=UPI00139769F5|nr:M13 family metallopeptidase [Spiroplasma sp. BIUS-1]QHX36482.1 endopeptidase O [Spiroplasma sp. BIUS-1]
MSKIRAQDNFFDHINKDWIDSTELPSGYPSWGSFEMLHKKSIDDIKEMIMEFKVKTNDLNSDQEKIVNLFNNYLNQEERNKQGIEPIKEIISEIDSLKDKNEFTQFLIDVFKKFNISYFHSKGIDSDFKNSNVRALMIGSMGLGMSDRDFYDESHPRHKEIKEAYKVYLEDIAKTSKIEFYTNKIFDLVYNFEKEISQSMLKQEELRSPENIYNVVSIKDLNNYCSFINWDSYLTQTGYSKAEVLILSEPKFMEKLNEMLTAISLDDLKDFMKIKTVVAYSSILSLDLYQINFNYSSVFSGVKEMKPEIDRAVEFTNSRLGELLGQEYVKKHFSKEAKEDVLSMVNDLIRIYSNRIKNLEWMSQTTKDKAIDKLNSFTVKIGYPDKFEDYSKIEIRSYEQGGSLYENMKNLSKYFLEKELREINLPVDKTKWYMDPQTVNAYYNPTSNEICFPAGILQKPFYDINEPRAKNLGGIGAVIGHEVSHGFDDEGSKFDKNGNFENWWTEDDYKQYSLRTEKLVEQYNKYEINGTNVNGKLTLGENIGDLSGVAAALDICKEQCPEDIKLFFENYATVWMRKSTDELKNTRLLIDPHSPEEFRCNGVLINIDEFHDVYETQPGDGMYLEKEKRIKIW